jgi:hypothetical protein
LIDMDDDRFQIGAHLMFYNPLNSKSDVTFWKVMDKDRKTEMFSLQQIEVTRKRSSLSCQSVLTMKTFANKEKVMVASPLMRHYLELLQMFLKEKLLVCDATHKHKWEIPLCPQALGKNSSFYKFLRGTPT